MRGHEGCIFDNMPLFFEDKVNIHINVSGSDAELEYEIDMLYQHYYNK